MLDTLGRCAKTGGSPVEASLDYLHSETLKKEWSLSKNRA